MKNGVQLVLAASLLLALAPARPASAQCSRPVFDFGSGTIDDHFVVTSTDVSVPRWKKDWDRARKLYADRKFAAAQKEYERVLARKDNVDQARWEYITLLMCRELWDKAASELDILVSHDGERPDYLLAGAEITLGRGEYLEAVRLFADLYSRQCDTGGEDRVRERILTGYIAALEGVGRVEVLVPLLEQLIRLRPHDTGLQKQLAGAALANGQPRRALNVLRPLLQTLGDQPDILESMARAYQVLGDADRAGLFWQRSIGTGQASPAAHAALQEYYHRTGNRAMELLQTRILLAADRKNPELLKRAGRLNVALGRPDRALGFYNRLLALQPHDYEITRERNKALHEVAARLFALIENSDPALLWPDLIQVTADRDDVFRELAGMLRRRGMTNELIELLTIMNREHPDDIAIRDELASLLHRQAAGRTLARARDKDNSDPVSITR
jgi:tetratricopeptide (TPR) repeat protein